MEKKTRLFLVRHGETDWNKNLRYQGHQDIPLNEAGREQARKVASRLAREKIDAAYASDLSRALETAQAIAAYHNLDVQITPELRETNFGLWEGLTYKEIDNQFHEIMGKWRENPWEVRIPEGESLNETAKRCQAGITKILQDNPHKNVLVVAHGGIIRIAVATVLGMKLNDYWKFRQDNVSVNIIDYYDNERSIVSLLNDTCHLE